MTPCDDLAAADVLYHPSVSWQRIIVHHISYLKGVVIIVGMWFVQVNVEVLRGDKKMTVDVTLESRD